MFFYWYFQNIRVGRVRRILKLNWSDLMKQKTNIPNIFVEDQIYSLWLRFNSAARRFLIVTFEFLTLNTWHFCKNMKYLYDILALRVAIQSKFYKQYKWSTFGNLNMYIWYNPVLLEIHESKQEVLVIRNDFKFLSAFQWRVQLKFSELFFWEFRQVK